MSIFQTALKLVNVIPVYKKVFKNSKETYRPVRIFPNISKAYEKFMFNYICEYFDSFLPKFQFGSRKG